MQNHAHTDPACAHLLAACVAAAVLIVTAAATILIIVILLLLIAAALQQLLGQQLVRHQVPEQLHVDLHAVRVATAASSTVYSELHSV
jgi:hypothetical protein